MNKECYFSIIIPIYNSEIYLKQLFNCLNKLNPRYNFTYEILLINNSSTDNSELLIKKYCNNNKNTKYLFETKKGVGNARNLGLNKAKGKYIIFLDSDDIFINDILNECYLVLNKRDYDLLCFKSYIETLNGEFKVNSFEYSSYNNDYSLQFMPFICGKVYKAELIKSNNIQFPNTRTAEDIYFNYLYSLYAKSFINSNKIYYRYNYVSTSLSHSLNRDPDSIVKAMKELQIMVNANDSRVNKDDLFLRYASKYMILDLIKIDKGAKKILFKECKDYFKSNKNFDMKTTNLFTKKIRLLFFITKNCPYFLFMIINYLVSLKFFKLVLKKKLKKFNVN